MLRRGICEPFPLQTVQGGWRVIALDNCHFSEFSQSWAGGPAPPALPPLPLRFQGPPGQGDSKMQKAGCHLKPQEELLPRGRAAGMLEGVSRHPM